MLRKVELRIMAPTSDNVQLTREMEELEMRAKEAASSLFTLCHFSFTQNDVDAYTMLAKDLLTVTALLPMLRGYLSLHLSSGANASIVSKSIGYCDTVLRSVESAERILERCLHPGSEQDSRSEIAFTPFVENVQLVIDSLESCVKDMLASLAAAREESLSHEEHL